MTECDNCGNDWIQKNAHDTKSDICRTCGYMEGGAMPSDVGREDSHSNATNRDIIKVKDK